MRAVARGILGAILLASVAATALLLIERPPGPEKRGEEAFRQWLEGDPDRALAFAEFERFLKREGVGDVVPAWQLTRVDMARAAGCALGEFTIPPSDSWSEVVPTLELVDSVIIPAVGEVEVLSALRTPEANQCAGGASRSKHLTFEALDLRALSIENREALFETLCETWRATAPESRMGLGAYYDPSDPPYNPIGRFHIDAGGYRSWGRSYSSDTSPCR